MRVRIEGKDGEITLEGPLLGRGGEASIYSVPGRPDVAAKIYHNPSDEHTGKLAAMLAAPPVAPPRPGQHVTLAWPMSRLLEPDGGGQIIGYLMPRLDKAHLIWETYNPSVRREVCPHFHYGSLLCVARKLAAVVASLHECGYIVGDLNESNVLVTSEAKVTLIDADSFQVPGSNRLYRCRVGRPEYTPPELQGVTFADVDRLPQHDAFALAVLIFQLLMQGIHPFAGTTANHGEPDSIAARIAAGQWPYSLSRFGPLRPSPHAPSWYTLPSSVQELILRCFEDAHDEPELRPTAAEWQVALEEAEHGLTTCRCVSQHRYHRLLDRCPWCGSSSTIRQFSSCERPRKKHEEKPIADSKGKKVVHDPLPPHLDETPPSSPLRVLAAEVVLQAIGRELEHSSWLAWVGVALLGAVAGLIYALQHALSG